MGNICGFEWVFDGLPRRCVEFAGHIGAHRTAPFDMVAAVDDVRALSARLAAAEARAEKAEAQLRSRDAEVYYLRLHREWAHDKRRQMASGAGVDAYQQWLVANPEPQPPDGCAP